MRGYLTPETLPTDFVCRVLTIPNDIDVLIAVNGQINELTKIQNWELFGTITPEEVAEAMNQMWLAYKGSDFTCP